MHKTRRLSLTTALLLTGLALILYYMVQHKRSTAIQTKGVTPTQIVLNQPSTAPTPRAAQHTERQTVRLGDNLTSLFSRQAISPDLIRTIVYGTDLSSRLPTLQVGDTALFHYQNKKLMSIELTQNDGKFIRVSLQKTPFRIDTITVPFVKTIRAKEGEVKGNFAQSARAAGMTPGLIKQFVTLFQGKMNFSRDVAPHDHFALLHEEYLLNGKNNHPGAIVMALYRHHNKTFTAIEFKAKDQAAAYYDWQGHGLQPLFLKAPLKYKRISSKFSLHRLDPILHKIRPHYGVDYAAPTGTPIHSVGAGRIVFKGKDGGYGNAIRIRYSHALLALYAHMSRFASVHQGQRVKKGQVIGFVGETGWATGPHLHFGWYVNGIPKDPLKRPTFYNPPIRKRDKIQFAQTRSSLRLKWNVMLPGAINQPTPKHHAA